MSPGAYTDLLNRSDQNLKSAIPGLARDQDRMGRVEKAVQQLPNHHQLCQVDSHDLSMILNGPVHLAVPSPLYLNLKDYSIKNGGGSPDQLGGVNDYVEFNQKVDEVWANVYEKLIPGDRVYYRTLIEQMANWFETRFPP